MEQIYQGIIPYDEDGRNRFMGRAVETRQLFERILRNDYTVYYAASGEGKSSLIRAGLLPILRRRGFFPIYLVFQEGDFSLNTDITDVVFSRVDEELSAHQEIAKKSWSNDVPSLSVLNPDQLSELEKSSWWRIRGLRLVSGEESLTPIFIFDQFEEVFTKATYDWTDRFFKWLEDVTTDYVPNSVAALLEQWDVEIDIPARKSFKALFSFRTEYLGELDYWCIQKHYLPSLQDNRICLKPMTPEGASQVIKLNEFVLGAYALRIIDACSDEPVHNENSEKPCVSALVLSVVCLVLSEMSVIERELLLGELGEDQETAVNKILLKFYKSKLQSAGLDYEKDADYIRQIEDAFVDMNGKRRRRNTDEKDLAFILKWIDALSSKENGLIKVIGYRESDKKVIKTVEFPHDRICKAINAAREERQGRLAERAVRLGEWLQFGLISVIVSIIAFMWNHMIDDLAPLINNEGWEGLCALLHNSEPGIASSVSTLLLMLLPLILAPILVMCVVRKTRKAQIIAVAVSFIGVFCFGALWRRNSGLDFSSLLVPAITPVFFFVFLLSFGVYAYRLYTTKRRPSIMGDELGTTHSLWPVWGGYFFFCTYLFYECLTRTSFGYSTPSDSAWALAVLPLLYGAWACGFFRMSLSAESKRRTIGQLLSILVSIVVLTAIGYVAAVHKQSYGLVSSLLAILIIGTSYILLARHTVSRSRFFDLSKAKKTGVALAGVLILCAVFVLNLGYNPLAISPSRVHHVNSWRTITISDNPKLPLEEQRFGVVYATDGDTIVPLVKQYTSKVIEAEKHFKDSLGWKDLFYQPYVPRLLRRHFPSNPFLNKESTKNDVGTITWDSDSMIIEVILRERPLLEQYLHRATSNIAQRRLNSVQDSVDYFSAQLYNQLRRASINYINHVQPYNMSHLEAYHLLDSLQRVKLKDELGKLRTLPQDCMEDAHLVNFFREVTRWFLLCMIKDRIHIEDYISEFSLMDIYPLCFFPDIKIDSLNGFNYIKIETGRTPVVITEKISIAKELYSEKAYPWYNVFKYLCSLDMSYNAKFFESSYSYDNERTNIVKSICEEIDRDKSSAYDNEKLSGWINILNSTIFGHPRSEEDDDFMKVKNQIFDTLILIMKESPKGMYNNVFLAICKYLIMVDCFRLYDFNDDMHKIEQVQEDNFKSFTETIKAIETKELEIQDLRREVIEEFDKRKRNVEYLKSFGIDLTKIL